MKQSWLEPLLDPSGLLSKAGDRKPDLRAAAAMLLDGRTLEYLRAQDEVDLPPFGQPVEDEASLDRQLIAGISLHLSGDPSAAGLYRRVAETAGEEDLRIVGGVLAAIALDDQGDVFGALEVLDSLTRDRDGLVNAGDLVLLVQRSVRLAEAGEWQSAIEAAADARANRSVEGPVDWVDALRRVAASNLLVFQLNAGMIPHTLRIPLRSRSRLLSHVDDMISEGLGRYFNEQFDSSFVHPYEQSVRWSAQDAVAAPLFGSLLRVECLGDWMGLERVRKLAGRYVLLSSVGRPERQPMSGFHLLRRAGDTKGIERGVETYRRLGPLAPLRSIGEQVVQSQWLRRETPANLALLASVADFLSQATATDAVSRVLSKDVLLAGQTWEALRALPSLLQSSDVSSQAETAQTLLDLMIPGQHPLVVQGANAVVGALRWGEIPPSLARSWLEFAAAQIEASPYDLLAASVLRALSDIHPIETKQIALDAFKKEPSIFLAAVCAEVDAKPPLALAPVLSELLRGNLSRIRSDASKGSFSMAIVNTATAATWFLLASPGDAELWRALVDFIKDAQVTASEKADAIDALAERSEEIPPEFALSLSEGLESIAGATPPLFGFKEEIDGAVLRLGLRLRNFPPEDATGRLLALAAGSSVARIEAARSVPAAAPYVPMDALASLVLSLTQDPNLDVRFAGASVLAGVAEKTEGPLAAVLRARIKDLVNDPGALVPLGACRGIRDARQIGFELRSELERALLVLSRTHLSNAVRRAALEAVG
jgi:hypothetical protein